MPTWAIISLIVVTVLLLYLYFRKKSPVVPKPKAVPNGVAGLGLQVRNTAEQIPVYGTVVKAVAVVGHPINQGLNKVNTTISAGLEHVPVVGHYLALPNEVLGSGIKKFNDWAGL